MLGLFRVFLATIVAADHVRIPIFGGDLLPFEYDGDAPVLSFFVISGFYMALVLDTRYMNPPSKAGASSFMSIARCEFIPLIG
jgi:peptidoglycan/LPS O-acetylase OafA/YrhL